MQIVTPKFKVRDFKLISVNDTNTVCKLSYQND